MPDVSGPDVGLEPGSLAVHRVGPGFVARYALAFDQVRREQRPPTPGLAGHRVVDSLDRRC
jgi:hypothetical protein